jgi:hypothetical protein
MCIFMPVGEDSIPVRRQIIIKAARDYHFHSVRVPCFFSILFLFLKAHEPVKAICIIS